MKNGIVAVFMILIGMSVSLNALAEKDGVDGGAINKRIQSSNETVTTHF